MTRRRHPTPFTYPPEVRVLVRRLYPEHGARRTAELAGVSVRTVYRWCRELTRPAARRQTAAAAEMNRLRGEARRLERNLALLEAMGDETDPARLLAYALALEARPPP